MKIMQCTIGNFEFITEKMKLVTKVGGCICFPTFQRVSFLAWKNIHWKPKTLLGHLTTHIFSHTLELIVYFKEIKRTLTSSRKKTDVQISFSRLFSLI